MKLARSNSSTGGETSRRIADCRERLRRTRAARKIAARAAASTVAKVTEADSTTNASDAFEAQALVVEELPAFP
ncbi:MAG: hypothetical protein WCD76_01630 [Pyrinomonadaceae bacterium]